MAKTAKKPEAARPQKRQPKLRDVNRPDAAKRTVAPKVLSRESGSTPKPDTGTKQSRVLSMLGSPTGATIAAIMAATGWQQHSVRGFLAGVVRKRLKLTLSSDKVDGTRVYRTAGSGEAKRQSRKPKRRAA